jgi:hypothetical protein
LILLFGKFRINFQRDPAVKKWVQTILELSASIDMSVYKFNKKVESTVLMVAASYPFFGFKQLENEAKLIMLTFVLEEFSDSGGKILL